MPATSNKHSRKKTARAQERRRDQRTSAGARRKRLIQLDSTWTPDDIKKKVIEVWDQTTPGTNCASVGGKSPLPKEDCNCYIKNSTRPFVSSRPFDDPSFDADAIIGELGRAGSGWTALGANPDAAMTRANAGDIVIAGMTSSQLSEAHGHLAFVVIDKEFSGTWNRSFPRCCAGALNAGARVNNRGVHFTFPTQKAMGIRYFARTPDVPMPSSLLFVNPDEMLTTHNVALKGLIQNEPPIDADPTHLLADFRSKVDAALATLQAAGKPFKLIEGFRTVERQQWLYGSGRPTAVPYGRPGMILTNADGVNTRSKHQGNGTMGSGSAADCYPTKNGKVIVPIPASSDPIWTAYANAVKAQGLVAGHDFAMLKDSPHSELG
jgi:hypothetical protein